MRPILALTFAGTLALGGCASDPYGYGGGYTYHESYPSYTYGSPSYSYGPAYGYPAIGGTFYYRDDDRDHWRGRNDWRDRNDRHDNWRGRDRDDDRGRGRDYRDRSRDLDTRHGEAGNEAGH